MLHWSFRRNWNSRFVWSNESVPYVNEAEDGAGKLVPEITSAQPPPLAAKGSRCVMPAPVRPTDRPVSECRPKSRAFWFEVAMKFMSTKICAGSTSSCSQRSRIRWALGAVPV